MSDSTKRMPVSLKSIAGFLSPADIVAALDASVPDASASDVSTTPVPSSSTAPDPSPITGSESTVPKTTPKK